LPGPPPEQKGAAARFAAVYEDRVVASCEREPVWSQALVNAQESEFVDGSAQRFHSLQCGAQSLPFTHSSQLFRIWDRDKRLPSQAASIDA